MINNEYKNSSEVYKVQTFRTTHISKADLTGASLQGLKYDPFTLRYLAAAELDGAQMSENFKADLEQLHNPPET